MKTRQQLERNIREHKQAILLVNTRSRRGRLLYGEAKSKLEARGYTITKAFAIKRPAQMDQTIAKAMALKPELLIVGSGDGTLSTVVDHLAYTDTVLGYLPLGTTNNFGRSLHIQPSLDDAIEIIAAGKVAAVDLGKVNDDYFGNMTSMGVSAAVAVSVPRRLKRRIGRLAYIVYALKSIWGHKPFRVEVEAGGLKHFFYTHQFCVANGSRHGGRPIAADANLDNGTLVAYALGGRSRKSTVLATINHARTATERIRNKNLLTGRSFVVKTFPAQPIDIDGEVKASASQGVYKFDIAPNALKVFVPQSFKDE